MDTLKSAGLSHFDSKLKMRFLFKKEGRTFVRILKLIPYSPYSIKWEKAIRKCQKPPQNILERLKNHFFCKFMKSSLGHQASKYLSFSIYKIKLKI